MAKAATRRSWQRKKLPENHAVIDYRDSFSPEEYERIARGLIPRQMEDKWFIYLEDDTLHLHRSWTGFCLYEVDFVQESGDWVTREARVNRDEKQYGGKDDAYDVAMTRFLIRGLLLAEAVEFPMPRDMPEDTPEEIVRHRVIGYGRTAEDEP